MSEEKTKKEGLSIDAMAAEIERQELIRDLQGKSTPPGFGCTKHFTGKGAVYEDERTRKMYDQIKAGLGWPTGARAGYLVVIGERGLHYDILTYFDSFDIRTLLGKCVSLAKEWFFNEIYCDAENEPMMRYVDKLKSRPNFLNPPHLGDPNELQGYTTLIRELTVPHRKRLNFLGSPLGTPGQPFRYSTSGSTIRKDSWAEEGV